MNLDIFLYILVLFNLFIVLVILSFYRPADKRQSEILLSKPKEQELVFAIPRATKSQPVSISSKLFSVNCKIIF